MSNDTEMTVDPFFIFGRKTSHCGDRKNAWHSYNALSSFYSTSAARQIGFIKQNRLAVKIWLLHIDILFFFQMSPRHGLSPRNWAGLSSSRFWIVLQTRFPRRTEKGFDMDSFEKTDSPKISQNLLHIWLFNLWWLMRTFNLFAYLCSSSKWYNFVSCKPGIAAIQSFLTFGFIIFLVIL